MSANEHRASRRSRILLLARMRIEGETLTFGVRIRDLSAGGLRAQFAECRIESARVAVEIPHIGWVPGRVVWQDEAYIGIRFDAQINPEKARVAVTGNFAPPPPPLRVIQRRV